MYYIIYICSYMHISNHYIVQLNFQNAMCQLNLNKARKERKSQLTFIGKHYTYGKSG